MVGYQFVDKADIIAGDNLAAVSDLKFHSHLIAQ
jgi:hypothetical protein